VDIMPLWVTSEDAFYRVDLEEMSALQVATDIPGPFNLAVAVEDNIFHMNRTHTTRMVVVGSLSFLDPGVLGEIGHGNYQFISNSLRWMQDEPAGILVFGRRPPGRAPLEMDELQANIVTGAAMGGIPAVAVIIGVIVWLRRRHS